LITDTDPFVSDDKESISADPKHSEFVYAVWDRLQFDTTFPFPEIAGPTWFARTTNGGDSWESARVIYDPGLDASTIANQIAVLPDGTLIDLFVRFLHLNEGSSNSGDVTLAIVRSKDRGLTWSAPIVINTVESIGVVDLKNGIPLRTGDVIPNIAVDRESGTLYVVWQDARFSDHQRDGIVLSKSVDGGLSWSAPVQVNKVPTVQAFTPSVDTTEDGAVGVTYYDLRKDTSDPNVLLTDFWQISSKDGGATWHERHRGGSFDMTTAPIAGGYFVGDYEGLGHQDETFLPFFVMTNSGNLSNRTDVFAPLGEETDDRSREHEEVNAMPQSLKERVRSHRERRPH
jgi:BNR repeat-like domain